MPTKLPAFIIAIPVYDGVDLLDVAAPREMFSWLKSSVAKTLQVEIRIVAPTTEPITTRDGLRLLPDATFDATPKANLLWVPGGDVPQLKRTMKDPTYRKFLTSRARTVTYLASVCEGALLLADTGLLDGYKATTHWAFIPCLASYPKIRVAPGFPRFIVNRVPARPGRKLRYVVTGGGISSGLDEALEIIRLLAGKKIAESVQATTQYFPEPPVNGTLTPATSCPLDDQ